MYVLGRCCTVTSSAECARTLLSLNMHAHASMYVSRYLSRFLKMLVFLCCKVSLKARAAWWFSKTALQGRGTHSTDNEGQKVGNNSMLFMHQ